MKKNLLYLFTVLCTLSFFTACSDDDDEKNPNVLDVNTAYSGDKLDLKYSDSPLLGKEITFDTKDGKTATITMKGSMGFLAELMALIPKSTAEPSLAPGVIPGEVVTTISNIPLVLSSEKYTFEGTDSSNGREIKYLGEVEKDKLIMSLNVTMPENALVGTWNLAPIVPSDDWGGANKSQPIYTVWESSTPFNIDPFGMGTTVDFKASDLLTLALAMPFVDDKNPNELFFNVLQSVTFSKDGNISISYSKGSDIKDPQWKGSPINLAQYYVKDNALYLLLNPDMILQVVKSKAESTKPSESDIMKIVTEFSPMLSTGIPLAYLQNGDDLKVFANTELVLKFLNAVIPFLQDEETVKSLLAAVASNPSFKDQLPIVEAMLTQLPGVVKTTTKIELGINLKKN